MSRILSIFKWSIDLNGAEKIGRFQNFDSIIWHILKLINRAKTFINKDDALCLFCHPLKSTS